MTTLSGRLHLSENNEAIVGDLYENLQIDKFVLRRLAFSASLRTKGAYSFENEIYNKLGAEFRLHTIEQKQGGLFKQLLCFTYNRNLTDEEFSDLLLKHINYGVGILKEIYDRNPNNPDEFILLLQSEFGCEIPPFPAAPSTVDQNMVNIMVGYESDDKERPFIWAMNDRRIYANSHTAIIGDSGTGKTQLLLKILADVRKLSQERINLFILDYKGDISEKPPLLKDATEIQVLDPFKHPPLPINPFILENYSDNEILYSARQKSELFEAFTKRGGQVQKGILRDAVIAAYNKRKTNPIRYPDFNEVYAELKKISPKRDSLSEMLDDFTSLKLFHHHTSNQSPVIYLNEKSYILCLKNLPAYKDVIAFLVLERLYREMSALSESAQIRTCIVIDEAHNYLNRNNEFLDKLLREGRSKGFVVMLASQSPRDYKQKFDYGQFIENKFIFKCHVSKSDLQGILKLDDYRASEMVSRVMNQQVGWCVFNHSNSPKQNFTVLRASQFWEDFK